MQDEAELARISGGVRRARIALGGFSPTDVISMICVVLAVLLGFVGGLFISPAAAFLIASGETLVVGILAGMS